ncbi:MAG: RAMP superfamily CRISPR-associated protein [Candidatus Hermodarchaeota archaeon]
MSKTKKISSTQLERYTLQVEPRLILIARAKSAIFKPLNGVPSAGSKTSALLKGSKVIYKYKTNTNKIAEAKTDTYYIKPSQLRGAINHSTMNMCRKYGIEVCHSHDKKKTKDKDTEEEVDIPAPEGLHHKGDCLPEPCIVHQTFGSKGHLSKFSVFVKPVAFAKHESAQSKEVQFLHIATENRVVMSIDNEPIQDFKERYMSGEFEFEVDLTDCDPTQRGMLVEAVRSIKKLGRGYNTGYSRMKILDFCLVERSIEEKVVKGENGRFNVVEEVNEKIMEKELLDAMEAWKKYVLDASA